jgi:hypothetical protein
MTDLQITTLVPQTSDNERMLLARILASARANQRGTLLVSATRTANTISSTVNWSGYRAAIIYLNISAASGTGGIRPFMEYQDPVSSLWRAVVTPGSGFNTSANLVPYVYGLGVGNGLSVAINAGSSMGIPLSAAMRINCTHGDATSYTYSVGYELIS